MKYHASPVSGHKILLLVLLFSICGAFQLVTSCGPGGASDQEKAADASINEGTQPDQSETTDADGNDKSAQEKKPTDQASPDKAQPDYKDVKPSPRCAAAWSKLTQVYADATQVSSCEGKQAAANIANSLYRFEGEIINNNGKDEMPCVEVKCDKSYVYIATNALPHYDFIQTTPNVLKENLYIYRLPYTTTKISTSAAADRPNLMNGCSAAYQQYLQNPNRGTQTEPSGFCSNPRQRANEVMEETIDGKSVRYHKLACFGAVGFVLSGVPIFGPNEAAIPDPYGNPFVYMPDKAGESYIPQDLRGAAALDLCFGHTAFTMHYHGINAACFERTTSGKPAKSFASATSTWDWKKSLTDTCTKESGIVGWALDGNPIKGPCVCVKRDGQGRCTALKRARSGWVYEGLGRWGNDPNEAQSLGKDATTCQQDSDCCTAGSRRCRFRCKYAVTTDKNAPGGTRTDKRCMLLDYAWCTNRFVDRSAEDMSKVNFVYMDRCNGYQGPDGYAYHTTTSFPLVVGCFRDQPSDALDKSNALVQRPRP